MVFYAHSLEGRSKDDWQTVEDHLTETAKTASRFAQIFGGDEFASLCGSSHDIGKYSLEFQRRLEGGKRVDHSLAGAAEVLRLLEKAGSPALGHMMAHVISGHHTGLADGLPGDAEGQSLRERLRKEREVPDYSVWASEITLPDPRPFIKRLSMLSRGTKEKQAFALFFWTRMIFSCLVDADFLDTEAFIQPDKAGRRGGYPELADLKAMLDSHLQRVAADAPQTRVNAHRAQVLSACREAASWNPGLFSLTVPTGGGKTLSSLTFALDHALTHGLRRVIYVIPYTSIIEQTARVFREVFDSLAHAVVEHHSNVSETSVETIEDADDLEDGRTLAFENWDAPIIVTTAVQFFESLFAARSSRCRKLHNVAGSVVVLDEAQTLPSSLFRPCCEAIAELTRSYHVSFVLCTATQPEVGVTSWNRNGLENVREIVPDAPALFQALDRVDIDFIGRLDLDALATQLVDHDRALCVVDTRSQARDLCLMLHEKGRAVFHLSTWMCPAHRKAVLKAIDARLKDPEKPPLLLVSTSLIEAGVDIDFPVVYRAMSGLDSIAQAAGRCNREGKLDRGQMFVFELIEENNKGKRGEEDRRRSACGAVLRAGLPLLSPEATALYFNDLYSISGPDGLDKKEILTRVAATATQGLFPFRSVEKEFRFIETIDVPLIIPYDAEARTAVEDLRQNRVDRSLYRRLQQWTVGLPQRTLSELLADGAVEVVGFAQQHHVLINDHLYHGLADQEEEGPALGIDFRNPTFRRVDDDIFQ